MKLSRVDLCEAVQMPKLGMTKCITHINPSKVQVDIDFDETRGVIKATVKGDEPVFVFRENVAAFRELPAQTTQTTQKK